MKMIERVTRKNGSDQFQNFHFILICVSCLFVISNACLMVSADHMYESGHNIENNSITPILNSQNNFIESEGFNASPPETSQKVVFIHHSTGGYWLADDWGELGRALNSNNYFVSATNYGWGPDSIGDRTDIGNWWEWFRSSSRDIYLDALYNDSEKNIGDFGDFTRILADPGGENNIVIFKSCFPNSALKGSISDPIPSIGSNQLRGEDSSSPYHTISNAKGIYLDLLNYFSSKPDKLFVVITAPPLSDSRYSQNARAFNNWLVNNWLSNYSGNNVFVFDYYNVLTSNGGTSDTNDLNQDTGNHHRYWNGIIQHITNQGGNTLAYPSGDDHPSQAGQHKATEEFIHLLNIAYHIWNDGENPTHIQSISPLTSPNTGVLPFTLEGQNFKTGSQVSLINGTLTIVGTNKAVTCTKITCTFPLTGAPCRVWNLTVTNPDGQSVNFPNAFTITNATPTITDVSPTPVFNTTDTNLTITGTNFRTGVTAILTNISLITDNLTGTNLIKTGTTKIQYTFPTEGQPAGKYNLTVTNIDGTTITSPNIFQLKSPSSDPNITRTSPCIGKNNAALPITISGSGFRGPTATTFTGITVTLENETLGTTFTGTPTAGKTQSSKTLYYTLPLTGKPAGIYNLTVRNYDGSSVTNTSGFIITTTNPTVSAISPAIGYTTKDQPVTLTGTNFRPGAGVTLTNGSISYNGTGVTVASSTSLTCTFPLLTDNAEPGKYNLTVTNADGTSGTQPGAFTITTPVTSPVITRISPTSGLNNAATAVTITGKNFLKPAVTITNDTMSRTAKATAGKPQSTGIIYYTLPLTGLEPGSYRVNVTNQYGLTATISFPVNPTKPTITKISPALGYTTGDTPITITGINYRAGAEVNLSNATTRLLATSTVVTPTTITCSVPTTGMTAGTYNLTVMNTDGTNVTKPSGFTVKNPGFLPTITGITPNTSANSAARAVTITGTNFSTTGAQVKFSTDGYPDIIGIPTAGKVQAVTRLYYTLPLTGVPDGKYNLTVINKDGLEVSRSEFFTVTASKPTIAIDSTTKKEKISPVSAFNTSPVNITILGTNFRNGVQVNLTNMSAVVEGQVITRTNTQIVSQFSLSGIPAGKYNLTIRNTDGTNVTAKTLFDVKKPGSDPVISSITPASAFNSGNLAVTITGKYFNKPAVFITQGSLSKKAIATANKVSTSTTLYVTLPLTGVPGGLYDLTVRNADGASTTAEGIFWVTDKASVSSVQRSPVVGNSARMPVGQVPQIMRPAGIGGQNLISHGLVVVNR